MSILIEVAVGSARDAAEAQAAGADRIELNSALELGGLTPSPGLVDATLAATKLPVIAMARPRPAGFAYDDDEVDVIARDAKALVEMGVSAVAFGVLTADHWVHNDRAARIVDAIGDADSVFHRAFDLTPDPFAALDALITLGVTRVLTSGQCDSAADGAGLIRRLIDHANGRIQIIPGAGITDRNVTRLVQRTGCAQLHGSFSADHHDEAGPVADSNVYRRFDPRKLAKVREKLAAIASPPNAATA